MQALQITKFSSSLNKKNLALHHIPSPGLKKRTCLIQIAYSSVNKRDPKLATGMMPHVHLPMVPGSDFSGIVVKGPQHLIGEKVFGTGGDLGFERHGSHAEYLLLAENEFILKPSFLSEEEAASVGVPFTAAFAALVQVGNIKKGDHVFIYGANGLVGKAAMQIAKWKKAHPIGGVRDNNKAKALRKEGYQVVNINSLSFKKKFIDKKPFDLVLNSIGGSVFEQAL